MSAEGAAPVATSDAWLLVIDHDHARWSSWLG